MSELHEGFRARPRAASRRCPPRRRSPSSAAFWVDQGDEVVAPMAGELASSTRYEDASRHGIGHLTRVYGTRPVDPVERAAWLWGEQRRLRSQTRLGIPAIVHEECLTGLAAWKAATFPTPLAWGASFDPEAVEQMAATDRRIDARSRHPPGARSRARRDPRPAVGARRRVHRRRTRTSSARSAPPTCAVCRTAGVDATLKHFVGYSASRAGRNHAPVSAGPREVADVLLPPFEMAVRDGGARSVMNSYAEIDGMPVAASPAYLTELLRDDVGLRRRRGRRLLLGAVPADHARRRRADLGDAARLALTAGIDVELPERRGVRRSAAAS